MISRPLNAAVIASFRVIGEGATVESPDVLPWMSRSAKEARLQVFCKYLCEGDVHVAARWAQPKSVPSGDDAYGGIEYLIAILDERSGAQWRQEVAALEASLPSVIERAEFDIIGMTPDQINAMHVRRRRDAMHAVAAPEPECADSPSP